MVNIHVAYTTQINPPGVKPVLTRAQLWAGLNRKVRRAQDFVPVFESCTVIEEYENVIVRETTLKDAPVHGIKGPSGGNPTAKGPPGGGPPRDKVVREVCKLYEPIKVDFHEPTGSVITNLISDGPGMTDEELNMTYFFQWQHPDAAAGSEEEKTLTDGHRKRARMAVDKSIESMRRMAAAGEL